MKKILITGANGFVAKHLKNLFSNDEVFLVDISGNDVIRCDITDIKAVDALLAKTKPDEIYHLAAIASPRNEDRALVHRVNVDGTLNILSGVKKYCPEAKVLLVSSGYVYGNCLKPATEKSPTNPTGIYAESKLEMEQEAVKQFPDLNIYIARPFTHSGRGQNLGFFFPDMAKKIFEAKKQANPKIEVFNPQTKRDFAHVDDVVSAYKLILEKGVSGEVYNICSGKAYEIHELVRKIAQKAGLRNYDIKEIVHGVVLDLLGDCSKIQSLGWKTKKGIGDIVSDFTE